MSECCRVYFCALHSAAPETAGERDRLRALLSNLVDVMGDRTERGDA